MFRILSRIIIGLMVVSALGYGAYLIEPKADLGFKIVPVSDTNWERTAQRSGGNMASFRAVVTLPNGNSALMSTQPQLILDGVQACAHIRSGKWSKAFHIKLVDPALCH